MASLTKVDLEKSLKQIKLAYIENNSNKAWELWLYTMSEFFDMWKVTSYSEKNDVECICGHFTNRQKDSGLFIFIDNRPRSNKTQALDNNLFFYGKFWTPEDPKTGDFIREISICGKAPILDTAPTVNKFYFPNDGFSYLLKNFKGVRIGYIS